MADEANGNEVEMLNGNDGGHHGDDVSGAHDAPADEISQIKARISAEIPDDVIMTSESPDEVNAEEIVVMDSRSGEVEVLDVEQSETGTTEVETHSNEDSNVALTLPEDTDGEVVEVKNDEAVEEAMSQGTESNRGSFIEYDDSESNRESFIQIPEEEDSEDSPVHRAEAGEPTLVEESPSDEKTEKYETTETNHENADESVDQALDDDVEAITLEESEDDVARIAEENANDIPNENTEVAEKNLEDFAAVEVEIVSPFSANTDEEVDIPEESSRPQSFIEIDQAEDLQSPSPTFAEEDRPKEPEPHSPEEEAEVLSPTEREQQPNEEELLEDKELEEPQASQPDELGEFDEESQEPEERQTSLPDELGEIDEESQEHQEPEEPQTSQMEESGETDEQAEERKRHSQYINFDHEPELTQLETVTTSHQFEIRSSREGSLDRLDNEETDEQGELPGDLVHVKKARRQSEPALSSDPGTRTHRRRVSEFSTNDDEDLELMIQRISDCGGATSSRTWYKDLFKMTKAEVSRSAARKLVVAEDKTEDDRDALPSLKNIKSRFENTEDNKPQLDRPAPGKLKTKWSADTARNKEVSPSPPRDPEIIREDKNKEEVPIASGGIGSIKQQYMASIQKPAQSGPAQPIQIPRQEFNRNEPSPSPQRDPSVVRCEDVPDEAPYMPAPQTTRGLVARFKQMEVDSSGQASPARRVPMPASNVHAQRKVGGPPPQPRVDLLEQERQIPDSGEFENNPVYRSDVVTEWDDVPEQELPEIGAAKSRIDLFRQKERETAQKPPPDFGDLYAPGGRHMVNGDTNQKRVISNNRSGSTPPDVIRHEDNSPEELPPQDLTKSMLSKFRQMEAEAKTQKKQEWVSPRRQPPETTAKGTPKWQPKQNGTDVVDRPLFDPAHPEGGEFENQPVDLPDVVRESDPFDENELPEVGVTRNLLAKFQSMQT